MRRTCFLFFFYSKRLFCVLSLPAAASIPQLLQNVTFEVLRKQFNYYSSFSSSSPLLLCSIQCPSFLPGSSRLRLVGWFVPCIPFITQVHLRQQVSFDLFKGKVRFLKNESFNGFVPGCCCCWLDGCTPKSRSHFNSFQFHFELKNDRVGAVWWQRWVTYFC